MVERIERDDCVEGARFEVDRGEVAPAECSRRHSDPGAFQLTLGEVDAGHGEVRGELLCLARPAAAAELENTRAGPESRDQIGAPIPARIVMDRRGP